MGPRGGFRVPGKGASVGSAFGRSKEATQSPIPICLISGPSLVMVLVMLSFFGYAYAIGAKYKYTNFTDRGRKSPDIFGPRLLLRCLPAGIWLGY